MKFLGAFLAATIGLCFLYVGGSILLDPRADWGTGLMPPLVLESRKAKMILFPKYQAERPIAGLLLGSSRSFKFRPRDLESATGLRFFNFSVGGANTEDYLAIYRWVRRRGVLPRLLIIGHDPTTLHDQDQLHQGLRQNPMLQLELEGDPGLLNRLAVYKDIFTVAYARDLLRSLRLAFGSRPEPRYAFDPDGFIREPAIDRDRQGGTFDVERMVDGCIAETVGSFGMTRLSEQRKGYLEQLVEEAAADGAEIAILLTTNYHPRVETELVKAKPYRELLIQTRRHVESLRERFGAQVLDFTDLGSYGGDPQGWIDCTHIDEGKAARIVKKLASRR